MKERFIQFSLKRSFQGQENPQKYKNPSKIIPCMRFFVNIIYIILDIDIVLAAGPFLRPNILWYAQNSQYVQNFFFFPEDNYFFQFISIGKHLQFKETEYLIHYVKFEM